MAVYIPRLTGLWDRHPCDLTPVAWSTCLFRWPSSEDWDSSLVRVPASSSRTEDAWSLFFVAACWAFSSWGTVPFIKECKNHCLIVTKEMRMNAGTSQNHGSLCSTFPIAMNLFVAMNLKHLSLTKLKYLQSIPDHWTFPVVQLHLWFLCRK